MYVYVYVYVFVYVYVCANSLIPVPDIKYVPISKSFTLVSRVQAIRVCNLPDAHERTQSTLFSPRLEPTSAVGESQ